MLFANQSAMMRLPTVYCPDPVARVVEPVGSFTGVAFRRRATAVWSRRATGHRSGRCIDAWRRRAPCICWRRSMHVCWDVSPGIWELSPRSAAAAAPTAPTVAAAPFVAAAAAVRRRCLMLLTSVLFLDQVDVDGPLL